MEKLTVSENAKKLMGNKPYSGRLMNWNMFNREVESIWEKRGKVEFVGMERDKRGTMYCLFRERIHHPHGFKNGKLMAVDNDGVFDFQKNRKPIGRNSNYGEIRKEIEDC